LIRIMEAGDQPTMMMTVTVGEDVTWRSKHYA
jgi:hypothetical protein